MQWRQRLRNNSNASADEVNLTILGPPRTKKTHQQIVWVKGKPRIIPSKPFREWENNAIPQIKAQWKGDPISEKIKVTAIFYRQAATGDLNNYMQALADTLQNAGVIKNDSLIESWDGSRKLKDAKNPRVEVKISGY